MFGVNKLPVRVVTIFWYDGGMLGGQMLYGSLGSAFGSVGRVRGMAEMSWVVATRGCRLRICLLSRQAFGVIRLVCGSARSCPSVVIGQSGQSRQGEMHGLVLLPDAGPCDHT